MRLHHIVLLACLTAPNAWCAEPDGPPLRAGVLASAAPFVMQDGQGQLTGFTIELFRLMAARMGRPIIFTTAAQPALFTGLAAGTYDLLPGPIPATPDRAAEMLLTEGYLWSEFCFGARAGEPVRSLADLHGRRVAVRAGSPYAEWGEQNAGRYGFTVVQADTGADAAGLVVHGQADASLGPSPVQEYAASRNENFVAGLSLPETRTHESAAFRRSDVETRDEMEDALRCLKQNGTVARLSKRWFGREPDAEDLENLVVPGYGVPGLFVVAPGADVAHVAMNIGGTAKLKLSEKGDLEIGVNGGTLVQPKPRVYQRDDHGVAHDVDASYRLIGKRAVGFEVASYDRKRPLVIDPVIGYSTYLGNSASNSSVAVAQDSSGNAFIVGTSPMHDFSPSMSIAGFCARTPSDARCTPQNVMATPGEGSVSISWSAVPDALSYNLYRSVNTPVAKERLPISPA